MASIRTLEDLISRPDIQGLHVLVRADLNVPLTADGTIRDATRIERLLPTFQSLCQAGAKVAVLSHFGRPKGAPNAAMSLEPIANALANLIDQPISFSADCIGPTAAAAMDSLTPGSLLVMENTRFHPGEEENDAGFAAALAASGDAYVNDAFSTAHRAHASTEALAGLLPAYAGLAMQAELDAIAGALEQPERPLMAVVGGAKVSTKLALLSNLVEKVDKLVIGGGMANTFLAAQGHAVGRSLCEDTMLETARQILGKAAGEQCEIILPSDVVMAADFGPCDDPTEANVDEVPDDMMILDAGPQAVAGIKNHMNACRTLVWNGPLGAFELNPFDAGTNDAARHAAGLTQSGKLTSVAGGGDTVAALNHAGAAAGFTYVSTAGGAFLEWLEGRTLPGVKALENSAKAANL
ncbi:MAG: phosphoglycerate kinase [Parvibaculales bacterium]